MAAKGTQGKNEIGETYYVKSRYLIMERYIIVNVTEDKHLSNGFSNFTHNGCQTTNYDYNIYIWWYLCFQL